MKCKDLLEANEYNKYLSKEERELVLKHSISFRYNKGESLVKAGEFINNAILIHSGFVKVHLEYKRRGIIFSIVGPGKFIALNHMLSLDLQPFDITAIDATSVCMTDISIYRQILKTNSQFTNQMLDSLNKNVINYVKHNLYSLTQNNIHGRLANILIYLSEVVFHSNSFDMLLTRKELSELCNISRENVIKVLYEFTDEGIINLNGKYIQIISMDGLRRICNHG